jgi:hypothetical protein
MQDTSGRRNPAGAAAACPASTNSVEDEIATQRLAPDKDHAEDVESVVAEGSCPRAIMDTSFPKGRSARSACVSRSARAAWAGGCRWSIFGKAWWLVGLMCMVPSIGYFYEAQLLCQEFASNLYGLRGTETIYGKLCRSGRQIPSG